MGACGSHASELEVMTDKGGRNFDRGAYQCQLLKQEYLSLNKRPRALIRAGR